MGRRWIALVGLLPLLAACDRPSVLVLGLDGASWAVLDPLLEAGALPNLRAIVEEGVRGEHDCAPALPELACFCPPVWGSLATGHDAGEHGITQVSHQPADRRVKAIWSVLRDHGGTSTTVGMRTTWPPDPDVDLVITIPGLAHAAGEIFDAWPAGTDAAAAIAALRTGPPYLFEDLELLPHAGERPAVWAPIARDRVAMEAVRRLLALRRTDLAFVLLHSPDKVAHVLWSTVQRAPGDPLDEDVLRRTAAGYGGPVALPGPFGWGTVAAPYLEIDAWLGALLADFPFDYVVLVSDHGMTRNRGTGLAGDHGPGSPEAHRGILVLNGPGLRRGADIGLVDVTDFAPTLAYLLSLPVGADLPGRVLVEAFERKVVATAPPFQVPSWEQPLLPLLLEMLQERAGRDASSP